MIHIYIAVILIIVTSCVSPGYEVDMPIDVQEDYQKIAEKSNAKNLIWQQKQQRLLLLGETDLELANNYRDSLINKDKSLSNFDKKIVDCITGEIHIRHGQFETALDYFKKAEKNGGDSPRLQVNRAICFVKLGAIDAAFDEINKPIQHNEYFYWYLGNLYEITGDKEKAIEQYIYLYNLDQEYYTYCKERADYLKNDDAILLNEIIHDFEANSAYIIFN
jgi:predicted Zn-dependent protease